MPFIYKAGQHPSCLHGAKWCEVAVVICKRQPMAETGVYLRAEIEENIVEGRLVVV